jgi:hypothetical protein
LHVGREDSCDGSYRHIPHSIFQKLKNRVTGRSLWPETWEDKEKAEMKGSSLFCWYKVLSFYFRLKLK